MVRRSSSSASKVSASQWLLLRRGITRGVASFSRDKSWLAMFAAMTGIVFLTQVSLLLVFGVRAAQVQLESQSSVRLQLRSSVTDQQIQEFYAAIRTLPYVEKATYITKEQAYEMEKQRDPELLTFLERFQLRNPFPDTIVVTLASLNNYGDLTDFVRNGQWSNVVDPTFLSRVSAQEQEAHALASVASGLYRIAFVLVGLVVITLLFVLSSLVRTRALEQKDEITIQKLVGAPELSIEVPFMTEITILLFLALLLGGALFGIVVLFLPSFITGLQFGGVFYALRQSVENQLLFFGPFLLITEIISVILLAIVSTRFGLMSHAKRMGLFA
jgi:cell division transport system permease protein